METLQIKILNPKAKNLLNELSDLKLIRIEEEQELYKLSPENKKSIRVSRLQVKNGEYKSHKTVVTNFKRWLKANNLVYSSTNRTSTHPRILY